MKTFFTCCIIGLLASMGLTASAQCVDVSQIDSTAVCQTVYIPVCGCNNITYSNACEAINYGGVTTYTAGVCSSNLQQCCRALFDYDVIVGIAGYTVLFDNLSTGCFANQLWEFGNGDTSSDFEPGYTYLLSQLPPDGKATVCLTVYNLPDSCYDKICGIVDLNRNRKPCVDSSLITQQPCPLPLVTVCGCDGNQYDSGCEATNNHGVTAWRLGACPATNSCNAWFDYEITATVVGFQVDFTNTSPSNNMAYLWDMGNGNTSSLRSPSQLYNVPGNYTVCLTVTDTVTSCTSTFCRVIQAQAYQCIDSNNIVPNPVCPAVVDPVCGCNGTTYSNACFATAAGLAYWRPGACGSLQCYAFFNFDVDTLTGIANFTNLSSDSTGLLWNFGDTTYTVANPTHTFATLGTYTVCLTITQGSCSNTYCDTVYIGPTGIEERKNIAQIKVYPNPFNSQLHVTFLGTSNMPSTVWITDLAGKRLATLAENSSATQFMWNAGQQPAGYYLLHYQSGSKIMVEKILLLK